MFRKSTLLLIVLFAIVLTTGVTGEQLNNQSTQITDFQSIIKPSFRAQCLLQKTNLTAAVYNSGFDAGYGIYTFYNPAVECAAASYPFAITDFSFTLYDDGAGNSWPQTMDIVVYAMADITDSCAGPGDELCRITMSPDQANYLFPQMGTYSFPDPCCVDEPFFIGVEYPAGITLPVVSLLFDDQFVDICQSWGKVPQGFFYNWDDFWTDPVPGWPLFAVGGETDAAACLPSVDCPTWVDGNPYKSENPPQLPDEAGWDVNATFPKVLADDFMCGETGYIKDLHFWGSWKNGEQGEVTSFMMKFYSDIPASQSPTGYSMPGEILWEREIRVFKETPIVGAFLEGWYDPYTGEILTDNHQEYMQYDVCLTQNDWFPQEIGTIYWLEISAIVGQIDYPDPQWGWKSTRDHWNDDAVWFDPSSGWVEMYEPDILGPITNQFSISMPTGGQLPTGGGEDAYGDGWYLYPSGWTNIWFYDHPFDDTRYKRMHVEFTGGALDPTSQTVIEFALNWSTDAWSNSQLPGDSSPPLPGEDEALYIGRTILLSAQEIGGVYVFDFEIPDYNPEWVSIDVRGSNFWINGILSHECIGNDPSQSMDLSFVITGDPQEVIGACCLPDGSCFETDAGDCAASGGDYQGDGTDCATVECTQPNNPPVALCQDIVIPADANCEGCGSIDAGSYDPDGDPITLDLNPPCPYPLGTTIVELTVTDDAGATDKCAATVTVVDVTPPVAICPADIAVTIPAGSGSTNVTFAVSATDNCPGVTVVAVPPSGSLFPVGVTNVIVTATDAAGLTDVCSFKVIVREDPPQGCPPWKPGDPYKQENPPQLPDEAGWNVNATAPKTLADDFMCGETGYIKDIHFWGSWLDGNAGTIRGFIISFHEDIPASPTGQHSRPGKLLYERGIDLFTQNAILGAYMEGWYDPWDGTTLTNNHQEYWQYDICLDSKDWFHQEAGTIYWLNISAIVEEPVDGTAKPQWGWKSSTSHWNDDAVHLQSTDSTCIVPDSNGTVHLPPDCPLVPQDGGKMVITEGLPDGATIEIEILSMDLSIQEETQGSDGNRTSSWQTEMVALSLTGTGPLSGFSRTISLTGQGSSRANSGDLNDLFPPGPIQSWDTEILSMDLSLFGDPDFDVLRITAGSDNGLPCPGHTTITRLGPPGSNWSVDSFFDITYRIDFQGAPGSALDGMSGETQGTIPMGTNPDSDESGDWREMYEPLDILGPINNPFFVEVDEDGNVQNGDGEGAYGNGWYNYPQDKWWNIWFYDHPFDANRYKQIHVELDIFQLTPGIPSQLEFAVNWSTDAWSNDQPPTDSAPPLPGVDEDLYIGREILLSTDNPDGHFSFDYTIDTYNPEWVSIDVRGFNFVIDGFIVHECIGEGTQQSMDLSFVITGDPFEVTGACCLPDGTCIETDAGECAARQGTYEGDGTICPATGICSCCGTYTNGYTGNTNCDVLGLRNLADITRLIDNIYISKLPLCCPEEGNTNGDQQGLRNLADITRLIDNIYISKNETEPCL